ncbi:serine/threonine protein kinase [Oerskovia sp. NPDC057915]|uniref:serine/threonine protein kinase n=1 Tax=Oerskovia sp. NPDC057915 TaxID=3346280 RepID=UPI0036DCCD45
MFANYDDVRSAFPEFDIELPELGVGGFKTAFKIRGNDGAQVLKVLHEPLPQNEAEQTDELTLPDRFAREIVGMQRISSPHVVQLLQEPSTRFIGNELYIWYVEPYYGGGTLQDRIVPGGDPVGAKELLVALLRAVRSMWNDARIVHRDIKPGNIVYDEDNIPVLLDLGIAYHDELSPITASMDISPRTPRYAAPEQFLQRRNVQIDFRTDLFLVGMVCLEVLTGTHPFWVPGIDANSYVRRLESFDPSMLEPISCHASMKQVISRLLAARPSRRYRNVETPLVILGAET